MCQMMMKMEMRSRAYKICAFVLFGVLITVALVLLIVLEVQWIKYWHRLLKQDRL
jgi:tellurite resistance protein TehA-like permease